MLKLLAPLLSSAVSGEFGSAVKRAKRRAVFLSLIGILSVIGGIFLLVAGYIALAEHFGELHAALILAGGAFVLALLAYIIMKISEAIVRKRQRERSKVDTSTLLTIAALAAAPTVLKSRGLLMLAVPVVAFAGLSLLTKKKKPSSNDGA
ncbi:hypothetical protein [Phyllobacterium myrsinacearum]|uniref:Uncharacterized BrkB/YihY/UPF0761 family membrane protein n=1 Tax=Phyllobacterium myrsinacearum TaxID=28101 RepID=A0A839EIJ7_9HYPH|nr:hypothetical protein [Phyllobacterium myrsinacearum]MBA8878075.1 uncharacterized BrkB/YihY/UPF0761 family membrane protein [Phyllobacterium myrsinacearum]